MRAGRSGGRLYCCKESRAERDATERGACTFHGSRTGSSDEVRLEKGLKVGG